ncbi:MAG: helix-turn-helix domain-containing protein [Roseburia sp.]
MISFSADDKYSITLCNFNYSPEGILHPDRIMQEYDFLYMLQGKWEIIEDEVPYALHEGELLILEPGRHHYSREKCTPHMRNMFLHCLPLPAENARKDCMVSVSKLTDCRNAPGVSRIFQDIIEAYWNPRDLYRELRLGNLFSLLLLEIAGCRNASDLYDPLVNDLQTLFVSHTERFFHLDELSVRFGLSARTLNSRFKNVTGSSLYQYQLTQKLNMIHELLPQNPERGLRDIALSFGFYDEFQMSRLYKRQFGFPPSRRR